MDKVEKLRQEFVKLTGMKPQEDWAAYFSFISAKLSLEIHAKIFEDPKSNNKSPFEM